MGAERIVHVRDQLHGMLTGTSLAGADIGPVSVVKREGLDVLEARLDKAPLSRCPPDTEKVEDLQCLRVCGIGPPLAGTPSGQNRRWRLRPACCK
jgi:hypothetical protein